MENLYGEYIDLLMEIKGCVEQLSDLARRKIEAVRNDDLVELNEVMKQEQAMALAIRGHENRRGEMLSRMGLSDVPLSGLPAHYPEDIRYRAKETADDLIRQFEVFRGVSDAARTTIECNLHEVEKLIEEAGGEVPSNVVGYGAPNIEPPPPMKTDFRA